LLPGSHRAVLHRHALGPLFGTEVCVLFTPYMCHVGIFSLVRTRLFLTSGVYIA
jgi:hypothetical protein